MSEKDIENRLIDELVANGFEYIAIKNEEALMSNFKTQFEKLNKIPLQDNPLSDTEWKQISLQIDKGDIYAKAKLLRESLMVIRDDDTVIQSLKLFDTQKWCNNIYQVTNQTSQVGKHKNIYDVLLLINGLPLVHIELKNTGVEIKEAFHQIDRYKLHTLMGNLYEFTQIYVISNLWNTRYFANNKVNDFNYTYEWSDKENNKINHLMEFNQAFLDKCHISEMIAKYMVISKDIKILRPYQYHAIKSIDKLITQSDNNGYIWHATGSGKTLTSFKASQLISELDDVDKVIFLVDRKDLNSQTKDEFNWFAGEKIVDDTDDTKSLVKQFESSKKLIVTTVQKLDRAITNEKHKKIMDDYKLKRVVFIIDECHRSHFNQMNTRLKQFFINHQLIGFTGTPIFKENKNNHKTTADVFGNCLHVYNLRNATIDGNVLKFNIEYYNTFSKKITKEDDKSKVLAIDKKEAFGNPTRINQIVDFIIENHKTKTNDGSAMIATSGIESALMYYDAFKDKNHNLKIATIFSTIDNEDTEGKATDELDKLTKDRLNGCIKDYNALYNTSFDIYQSADNYSRNIQNRLKRKDIYKSSDDNLDILIVASMFLTGFDSKYVNTMYVDKKMDYHSLIQAFSRTNRLNTGKQFGNILCFSRPKKEAVEDALRLFSKSDNLDCVLMKPYEEYIKDFIKGKSLLESFVSNPNEVDRLTELSIDRLDEIRTAIKKAEIIDKQTATRINEFDGDALFVLVFRYMLKLKNILTTFVEFKNDDLEMDEEIYNGFLTKYIDLKKKKEKEKEKGVSILDSIDFEIEFLEKVVYDNLKLKELAEKAKGSKKDSEAYKVLLREISNPLYPRKKRELVEAFLASVFDEYDEFKKQHYDNAINELCKEENLDKEKIIGLIKNYIITGFKELQFPEVSVTFIDTTMGVVGKNEKFKNVRDKVKEIVDTYER